MARTKKPEVAENEQVNTAAEIGKSEVQPPTECENNASKGAVLSEAMIYIGPNIPGGGLKTNTIFKGGASLPAEAEAAFAKFPTIRPLFIPVKDYRPTTNDNMRAHYNRALREINKA